MTVQVFKTVQEGKVGKPIESQLPKYQSHKTVSAAKIVAINYEAERRTYRFALDVGAYVDVTRGWVNSRSAHVGGYFVQYEDGYSSFSPAKAFEMGYKQLEPEADTAEPSKPAVSEAADHAPDQAPDQASVTAKEEAPVAQDGAPEQPVEPEKPEASEAEEAPATQPAPATPGSDPATGSDPTQDAPQPVEPDAEVQ